MVTDDTPRNNYFLMDGAPFYVSSVGKNAMSGGKWRGECENSKSEQRKQQQQQEAQTQKQQQHELQQPSHQQQQQQQSQQPPRWQEQE